MKWPDSEKSLLLSTMGMLQWLHVYLLERETDGPILDMAFEALSVKLDCPKEILLPIVKELWAIITFDDWDISITYAEGGFLLDFLLGGEKLK